MTAIGHIEAGIRDVAATIGHLAASLRDVAASLGDVVATIAQPRRHH